MKTMNVKKLAALAAGALFVGQTAHAALAADTLPTDKAWYLNSAIVIGANAKPADVVWAGNIAAAIGQMAIETEEKTASVDLNNATVKLSVPGEVVVGGEGRTADNIAFSIGAAEGGFPVAATSDDVTSLKTAEEAKYEVKVGTDWQERSYYVTTRVVLDGVNVENYEGELRATVVGYPMFVTEISGVEFDEPANGSGTTVTLEDGTDFKNVKFDVAGTEFKLTKVTMAEGTDTVTVEIATSSQEVTVYKDQNVDLGSGYTLKLVDVDKDNNQVLVEITDADGNSFTDILKLNEPTDLDGKLPFKVVLKDYFAGTTTAYAKIGLKADTKSFTTNALILGDGTAQNTSVEVDFMDADAGWKLKLYLSDTTTNKLKIDKLELYYNGDADGTYTSLDKGWKPGENIFFPGSDYGATFAGFTSAVMKAGQLGADITAYDPSGKQYTTKLQFTRLSMSTPASGSSKYTITNFINDKDLFVFVDSGGNVIIDTDFREDTTGDRVTVGGPGSEAIVGLNFDDDAEADVYFKATVTGSGSIRNLYLDYAGDGYVKLGTYTETAAPGTTLPIYFAGATGTINAVTGTADVLTLTDGTTSVTFNSAGAASFYVYNNSGNLAISSTVPATAPYMKVDITVSLGSNTVDDESATITGVSVYKPATNDYVSSVYVDADNASTDYDNFVVGDMDGTTLTVPVKTKETSTGSGVYVLDKVDLQDADATWSDGANSYTIDADTTSTEPDFMYTEWGTEVKAYSEKVELRVPTEQRYLKFFVGKPSRTVETTGAIEAKVGETVEVAGTQIKVEEVTAEGASVTYTEAKPMADWNPRIVYLDTEGAQDTYDKIIVVGGWAVNTVAAALKEKFDEVAQVDTEGEWIVKKFEDGGKEYIVVFGYTADDTGYAAKEFIKWLRQNVA